MLGTRVRRKPSRWCKTTRTEQDAVDGFYGPNGLGNEIGEWTHEGMPEEGCFEDNPREGWTSIRRGSDPARGASEVR